MEKAHLYEAWYLVEHGIDEAVRRSKKSKKQNGTIRSSRKPNGVPTPDTVVRTSVPEAAHE